ncbi:carbamoyltransferase [Streptomyces xanthophaeus]|uniref:carbamoyltransferase family protein n=1 Tax=Streptomyces xanthophaeus TaxID=67385 RepID=UPI0036AF0E73
MNILGINCVYHESSAAISVNGRIIAAAEEERFNRIKHGKQALVDNADTLPVESIKFCLMAAGLKPQDIDLIACSFDFEIRRDTFQLDPLSNDGDWGSATGERKFLRSVESIPEAVSNLLGIDSETRFRWVPHHIAHAASAYYPSGDEQAAVLVVDGIGESATALLGGGNGTKIHQKLELTYPNSIGFVWEKFSSFLGFSSYDACKVMGLATYGDASRYADEFNSIASAGSDLAVRSDLFQFRSEQEFDGLESIFGARRQPAETVETRHADLAAALQAWNNQTILGLAQSVYDIHPASTLCYSGGVALNCTTNWMLKEKGPFSNVFIPTAPHDAGTAIGAALWAYYESDKDILLTPSELTPYMGPSYGDDDILEAFAEAGVAAVRSPNIEIEVAERIADGEVVGWFQGRMELGPRALGNRSLVADPRNPNMRNVLNRKVKHREDFRPFAPSVLEDRAREWFELGRDSESYRYMLYTCPVRPEKASQIPAVLHIDGTARVQTVSAEENLRYHNMISAFERITGVPMVLNTSFNDSEPIVCSPRDALATFAGTRIDAVAIGDYIASRVDQDFD